MAGWTDKTKKILAGSKLMEPKTKVARLRALLPELEAARAAGHSLADIRSQLDAHGLGFPSYNAFQKIYWLAKKAGPLLKEQPSATVSGVADKVAGRISPKPETGGASRLVKTTGGAIIINPTTKSALINKNPNLENLI